MEIVDFVRRMLDEDERVAQAATRGPWHVANVVTYGSATVDGPDAMQDGGADGKGGRLQVMRPLTVIPQDCDYGPTVELTDAEHIARHDPDRVLREVKAKRRTLARHAGCGLGTGWCDDGGHGWDEELGGGCPELGDMALPYADHPDYREEDWRP